MLLPLHLSKIKIKMQGFPGGSAVKKKICLPMQDTGVQSLIQEDPTSCAPQLSSLCSRAPEPLTTELTYHDYGTLHAPEPEFCNKRSHHNEKPHTTAREKPLLAATREKPMQQ